MKISFLYGVRIDRFIMLTIRHGGISIKRLPSYFVHLLYGCVTAITSLPDLFWRDKGLPKDITFIVGHYRSGTSHLLNLMTEEGHFTAPSSYQCLFPHSFLSTEFVFSPFLNRVAPKNRPMDNMEMTMESPQEEEIAMAAMGVPTPYLSVHFPKNADYFRKLIHFKGSSPADVQKWQQAHKKFLRKLAKRHGAHRPIVLKSPTNTARMPILLEMYPHAKFVHIHRHPYRTIQSTIHLYKVWYEMDHFQPIDEMKERIVENALEVYEIINHGWLKDNRMIPENRKISISFDELQADAVETMRRVYSKFNIPMDEGKLAAYLKKVQHYRKNTYSELDRKLKAEINERFDAVFKAFDYQKDLL